MMLLLMVVRFTISAFVIHLGLSQGPPAELEERFYGGWASSTASVAFCPSGSGSLHDPDLPRVGKRHVLLSAYVYIYNIANRSKC